ncbi:MAG TPA: nucleoside recognition domain-containing protein [Thermodesulfobacteriota bacterium]|nr:nucleoside recognition domain-containing protein [Thermodesulfobacteriota bacterium]
MNTIWVVLIAASVVFSVINGRLDQFTKAIFEGAKAAVEISLYLLGIISLWLGITKIIEESGLIYRLSRFVTFFLSILFPKVPKGHPALTSMSLNFLANLFGLGDAATPLGIKAMQDLQTLNPEQDKVSQEMMLFVVINTSSIQLITLTVIGVLSAYGSKNPSAVVLPTILATLASTAFAVATLWVFRRILK